MIEWGQETCIVKPLWHGKHTVVTILCLFGGNCSNCAFREHKSPLATIIALQLPVKQDHQKFPKLSIISGLWALLLCCFIDLKCPALNSFLPTSLLPSHESSPQALLLLFCFVLPFQVQVKCPSPKFPFRLIMVMVSLFLCLPHQTLNH